MIRALIVLVLVVGVAAAEPLGATRIAVVDSSRFWAPGGVARWADARARLDAERSTYRPAEAPPGTRTDHTVRDMDIDGLGLPEAEKAKLRRELEKIDRDAHDKDVWKAHEAEVLGPIAIDVDLALGRFAKDHGIGLVLDRVKLDAALLAVAPGVDLTDAFIKDYNAHHKAH